MIFKNLFNRTIAKFGIAIGGNNYGNVTINNGASPEAIKNIDDSLQNIQGALQGFSNLSSVSEVLVRDAVDVEINAEIDNVTKLIQQNKPVTALQALTSIYERTAGSSQGKTRFRILANIGICHYLIGDERKASDFLLDAYNHAPLEPKAISNKTIALILQGKSNEAFDFAKEALELSPDNPVLAGYLIQASQKIPEILNPMDIIPSHLHKTSEVLVGYILYLQKRGSLNDWQKIANEGLVLFPENIELKYYSALAAIEDVFNTEQFKYSHKVTDTQFASLIEAGAVFHEKWLSAFQGEANLKQDDVINLSNLLLIYWYLNEENKSKQIILDAIKKASDDEKLLLEIAQFAFNSLHCVLTEKAVENINKEKIPKFLRFKIAEINGDDNYLTSINIEEVNDFPASEKICCKLSIELSKIKLSNLGYKSETFKQLLDLAAGDIRALLIIAHTATIKKNNQVADKAYQNAVDLFNPNINISNRMMLGREAYFRKDWSIVIDSYDGHILYQKENVELKYLAVAFANNLPIQERAFEFFDKLPTNLVNTPEIQTLLGLLYFNQGNLDFSEKHIKSALAEEPTNLYALTLLVNIFIQQDGESKLFDLLKDIDPVLMQGDPMHQMNLAQLLNKIGREEVAASFGYKVLSENLDNPKILMAFMGLFIGNESKYSIPESNVVTSGFWVQLTNQHKDVFEFLYDDDLITHIKTTGLEHPLVSQSIGLSINGYFEQTRGFGPAITWTINQIKHKYLHALHDVINTFETRFPREPFWRFSLPESDDVSTILESIKVLSEKEDAKLNNYIDNRMPLALIGRILGNANSIETAQKLLQKELPIYTNLGTGQTLEFSLELLKSEKFTSLVFDTYSIWHAAVANLLPILQKGYELIVPASVLSDIQHMIDEYINTPSERMSIGWHNGEYQRYESTSEDHQRMIDYIRIQKSKIEQYCKVNYVSWTDKPNEITSKMLEIGGNHFLDSAYLAFKSNMLLVSEDLFYREWATLALGSINSLWIDPILKVLNSKDLMSNTEIAEATVHFSAWKHTHIYLNPSMLIDIYNIDETKELYKLKAVFHFIGNENEGLMIDHTLVSKVFLNTIWKSKEKDMDKVKKATDLILNSLLRFSSTKGLYILLMCIESISELEEYLIEWRERNGISDDELEEAYTKLLANEDEVVT